MVPLNCPSCAIAARGGLKGPLDRATLGRESATLGNLFVPECRISQNDRNRDMRLGLCGKVAWRRSTPFPAGGRPLGGRRARRLGLCLLGESRGGAGSPAAKGRDISATVDGLRGLSQRCHEDHISSPIDCDPKTWALPHRGNIPCQPAHPCSPDGKWSAATGPTSLDAAQGSPLTMRIAKQTCWRGVIVSSELTATWRGTVRPFR
jgi:hypothetical protein